MHAPLVTMQLGLMLLVEICRFCTAAGALVAGADCPEHLAAAALMAQLRCCMQQLASQQPA